MSQLKYGELPKRIAVSEENYRKIKEMGRLGDTFNDVITRLLDAATRKSGRQ
jgi:predicted CopG family antitoxin